jgi:hypothetical protein
MADLQVWRIFSGPDGTSRMEQLREVPGLAGDPLAAKSVNFTRISKDLQPSWHCAPRRQMMATLVGEGEIETGDGQVLVLRPGIVTLLEDTHGVGHLTRPRGGEDRLAIVVPLQEA